MLVGNSFTFSLFCFSRTFFEGPEGFIQGPCGLSSGIPGWGTPGCSRPTIAGLAMPRVRLGSPYVSRLGFCQSLSMG